MRVLQYGEELDATSLEIRGRDVDTYIINYDQGLRLFINDDGEPCFCRVSGHWMDPDVEVLDLVNQERMLQENQVAIYEDNYLDGCVPVSEEFVCPLEYGDTSSLSDEDEAALNNWLKKWKYHFPTDRYNDMTRCSISGWISKCTWVKVTEKQIG